MPTRRRFLDTLLGSAVLGTLATVLYPVLRYLKPVPIGGPTGPARLKPEEVDQLGREQFVIVPVAGKRVLVFRDPEGGVRALDARCTHEGCTVQYVAGEAAIWCACHNARFDIEGRVLSGPPPRPLPRYVAHTDEEGGILVIAEKA